MRSTQRDALLAGFCIVALLITCASPASAQYVEGRNTEASWKEAESPSGSRREEEPSRVAASIVDQANALRAANRLQLLTENKQLSDAAQEFAEYMARTNRFGHTADERKPSERILAQDYHACLIAENIAYQYPEAELTADELATAFVTQWEESPGHRRNLLNPSLLETGVGIAQSESGTYFAVQAFARHSSKALRFTIMNRSKSEVKYELGGGEFVLPGGYTRAHSLCMPLELTLEPTATSSRQDAPLTVTDGDQFVIREVEIGQYTIERTPKEP